MFRFAPELGIRGCGESSTDLCSTRSHFVGDRFRGAASFENPIRRGVVRLDVGAAARTEIHSVGLLDIATALQTKPTTIPSDFVDFIAVFLVCFWWGGGLERQGCRRLSLSSSHSRTKVFNNNLSLSIEKKPEGTLGVLPG